MEKGLKLSIQSHPAKDQDPKLKKHSITKKYNLSALGVVIKEFWAFGAFLFESKGLANAEARVHIDWGKIYLLSNYLTFKSTNNFVPEPQNC